LEISGGSTTSGPCDPCLKGKQTREEIRRTMVTCADCALDNVFSDARKLLATQTQNGHKYLVTLVDDNSREASTHGPRNNSQVGQALKAFIPRAQPSTGKTVEVLYPDIGGECKTGYPQRAPHHTVPLYDTSPTHALDFFTPNEALSGNKPEHGKLGARSLVCTLATSLYRAPSYLMKAAYLNKDKNKYISAAPQSTSARRTLNSSAHPPSLTKHPTKLNSPEADVKAINARPRYHHISHARESHRLRLCRRNRAGPCGCQPG